MKTKPSAGTPPEAVISVIGAGMKIIGSVTARPTEPCG